MRIEHIALWTADLERCKQFYIAYFGAVAGNEYVNAAKGPWDLPSVSTNSREDCWTTVFPILDGPRRTGDG